jgi:hypothetical protein
MQPEELWWLVNRHRPRKVYGKGRGAMTEDEVRYLWEKYHKNKPKPHGPTAN